jgi:hypothetical protein
MQWVTVALAITLCACSGAKSPIENIDVLFVGNSLTYVGNLPAVFDTVSRANDRDTSSDMIVAPGATLTDRVNDGSVERALSQGSYSFALFQERGGDFMCDFGPSVCEDSRRSLESLAAIARRHGAVPLLVGTYQGDPQASVDIVVAESNAALAVEVDYVSVSDRLEHGRLSEPELEWFAADGMHPGHDLILMEALLLYEHLFATQPTSSEELVVEAPMYSASSGLTADLRSASDAAPKAGTPFGKQYDSERVIRLTNLLW